MLISIVTINFNGVAHIEKTLKSVIGQTFEDTEYIVIDGGSTDGSVDIIKQYDDHIDFYISEVDEGISDAMNKGIKAASGEYLIFLHSDDMFVSNESLAKAHAYIDDTKSIIVCDIYYGKNSVRYSSRGFNFWLNFKTGLMHQGILCPRSVFEEIGLFDTQFKIAMDYDFFLRAYQHGTTLINCPVVLSSMSDTGRSSRQDWRSLYHRFDEEKKIHHKNCKSVIISLAYNFYWPTYIFYRRIKFLFHKLKYM